MGTTSLTTHSSVTSYTHALRKYTPQSLRDSSDYVGKISDFPRRGLRLGEQLFL